MVSAINSNSIDIDLKKLAPTYQTAIQAEIDRASGQLNRTKSARDTADIRKGIYTDLKSNFTALQTAIQALISTQATYGMKSTAKASVAPATSGTTVLTATTEESTAAADYDIYVSQLAKAQSRTTGAFSSAFVALGKSGTFWLGGDGSPAAVSGFSASDTLTNAAAAAVATGKRELGTGSYTLESRTSDGVRQFRLVNADGNAVSIRKTDGSGYSSEWQTQIDGGFDTGRGVSLTLGHGSTGSTSFTYTATGVAVTISSTDTLRNITAEINAANQPEGRDVRASIVGNKLVLTGAQTGANHTMLYTDGANLGFGADLQTAQNAIFTVNGLEISRATNTNLTDVVDGTTINFASDAEKKTARLSITASNDKAKTAMEAMVTAYNAAFTHLTQKMATTAKTEGTKTTYTRAPLAGDTFFSGLRTEMYYQINRASTNSGGLSHLADLGLSFDKDMKLTLDGTKFSAAMASQPEDVKALLDSAMGSFNTVLSRHTGTTGTLTTSLNSMENQIKEYDTRISKFNDALTGRKKALYNKYLEYQMKLAEVGYEAQMFGIDLSK